jgi:transcriptional regulator with XRE-family HTH domain
MEDGKECLELCRQQDLSSNFASIVSEYLTLSGKSRRALADEFEVAESTVSRWANGVARPHPRFCKLVVTWIQKRLV